MNGGDVVMLSPNDQLISATANVVRKRNHRDTRARDADRLAAMTLAIPENPGASP
jgi:hypothetical protein